MGGDGSPIANMELTATLKKDRFCTRVILGIRGLGRSKCRWGYLLETSSSLYDLSQTKTKKGLKILHGSLTMSKSQWQKGKNTTAMYADG